MQCQGSGGGRSEPSQMPEVIAMLESLVQGFQAAVSNDFEDVIAILRR